MMQHRAPVAVDPIPPLYFFRFPDSNTICSLVSNKGNIYSSDQIATGDESMKKIISDYSHLIRRSYWKVSGQSFLMDKFIISVGKMDQGNVSNSTILKVSYVGNESLCDEVIYESIYAVAKSLFPSIPNNSNAVNSFMEHTSVDETAGTSATPVVFTIADRCLQWMACLKHNT
jgi:hypothetical protein